MALRPESACSIAPAQVLWGVVQLGGGDQERLRGGQVGGAFGHRDPVLWRGEANSVQLAVDLGQEVGPREGGAAFGHGLHRHAGRIGQDCVGQIAGAQQGQIIAIGETGNPRALVTSDVALGPLAPPAGHLGQAAMLFGRPGLERGPAAQIEHLGARRLATSSRGELGHQRVLALLDGHRALGELGHQGLGDPVTSKRSCSEWRRARPSHPHPNSSVNRSLSTPWCNSERATTLLNRPRLIERPPLAVGDRAGAVGHHDVVVELGIAGPRVPVGEGRGHHALDVFLDHAVGARARVEDLALGVGEHDLDGAAVARVDLRLGVPIGQRPGDGHRFGGREGEVEPGHRRAEGASPWPVPRPRCGPSPRPVRCRCGWPGWRQPAPPPALPGRGACGWAGGRAPGR